MMLRPGRNVWRLERAHRTAVILDAAAYFGAVRAALLKAERNAFIIGWDIHSQTRLVGPSGRAEDGYPERLADFLSALVDKRPRLEISLLLWDFAMLYATERELFPTYTFRWNTPRRVRFCLDNAVPFGSSQHQKLIVVDDAIAFTGGLDVTIRRWDTSEHRPDNPLRRDPSGDPYNPFHDVQMLLDGPAARALAELARARWQCVAGEPVPLAQDAGDVWPRDVAADFTDVEVGVARTQPRFEDQPEVREIEALFLDGIAAAERTL
jgi:phospholipase D1/2